MQFAVVSNHFRSISSLLALGFFLAGGNANAQNVPTGGQQTSKIGSDCTAIQSSSYHRELDHALATENAGHVEQALKELNTALNALGSCRLRAKIYVQIGRLELRAGSFAEAKSAAEQALKIHSESPVLLSVELGLNQFVIASAVAANGDFQAAIRGYNAALRFFERYGPEAAELMMRTYEDVAIAYVQAHDLNAAEAAVAKSIAAERGTKISDPIEDILSRDTLSHIEYQRGRLSDAAKVSRALLTKYGTSRSVNETLRAHLYEDYASLCMEEGKLTEAADYFEASILMQEEEPIHTSLPRTLALLARLEMQENQLDDASKSLEEAKSICSSSVGSPMDAALVSETYAALLNAKGLWSDARTELLRTLSYGASNAVFTAVRLAALRQLSEADHHLHLKREEKQLRKQARELEAEIVYPGANQVVDIATLRNSYTESNH